MPERKFRRLVPFLKPHEWDDWYNKQTGESILEVNNANQETVKIRIASNSSYDWHHRSLTNACSTCTLYIPHDPTVRVIEALQKSIVNFARPRDIREVSGICIFAESQRQITIPKFLTFDPDNPNLGCVSGHAKRFERAEKKRSRGEIRVDSAE